MIFATKEGHAIRQLGSVVQAHLRQLARWVKGKFRSRARLFGGRKAKYLMKRDEILLQHLFVLFFYGYSESIDDAAI